MLYKSLLRPLLFLLSPEKAHAFTLFSFEALLKIPFLSSVLKSYYTVQHPKLVRELFGLTFPNPVGLAAGFDKDGKHIETMECLGFGFIEVGTTTPLSQSGNPQPRLFRLSQDKGLINRMGFNNEGVVALKERLAKRKSKIIVGGNIGKNKITPNEEAISDYEKCFEALFEVVDYFVVNVSSPNTPNLRALQDKKPLTALLQHLQNLNAKKPERKPILLKIAPDLTNEQLDDIIEIVATTAIDGVIATNTTIDREGLKENKENIAAIGNGGVSGQPLTSRSTEVIRYLSEKSNRAFPIIGVGGIYTPQDAAEKLEAGASLLQVYTGLIYEGSDMVRKINKGLVTALKKNE
ncbi:MAG: quinone-dependent dihydroorotate dehydrogenase [Chitinophagales bacterium]